MRMCWTGVGMKTVVLSIIAGVAISGAASAATILETDFTGRVVSGDTASNITWTTNGVQDPGDLTVVGEAFDSTPFAATLFDTGAAQGRFAVDLNIHNEGTWSVEIPIVVEGEGITLSQLSLNGFNFNNSGVLQTVQRESDLAVSIVRDDTMASLFSDEAENIEVGNPNGGPFPTTFNVGGVFLAANNAYTLVLVGTAETRNQGNNLGFDDLLLTGEFGEVPLPAGLVLMLSALGGLAVLRRRA